MTHEFSICNELRTLGITANYKGYKQAAWAIHLALDDERRLDDISKEIYQPIAQLFFCYINSVERNLRTVSRRAWTLQREHFQENRRVRTARTTNRFRLSSHSGEPSPHECPSDGIH